mgnify:CR=1 FL=1
MQKIDEKQIQEWKEKYGSVYELPVEDKVAYLREPKMKDFKRAFTAMQNNGDLAFGEEMINVLFIGGDEEIKSNDDYFLPARKEIKEFFNFEEAEITKEKNNSIITIAGAVCKVRIITRDDLKIAERKTQAESLLLLKKNYLIEFVLRKTKLSTIEITPRYDFHCIKRLKNYKAKK